MKWISFPNSDTQPDISLLGGKGAALFHLFSSGFSVPDVFVVTTDAYKRFVQQSGLREKINLELNRKVFSDMRWEEIWDTALRIHNLFQKTTMPDDLCDEILQAVADRCNDKRLVIRSSAPDEDRAAGSFAGLHESYVNVSGEEAILAAVKNVWSSLWSDRALLYRQELGLNVGSSTMAVVIQELVEGYSSGIVFSRSPNDKSELIIEAAYGLNQGLIDGDIEPDRWVISRENSDQIRHTPSQSREYQFIRALPAGLKREKLEEEKVSVPPLTDRQIKEVAALGISLENEFGTAQDVEWTVAGASIYLLQSRPVTAKTDGSDKDKRSWYLSLHRSYDNLLTLWDSIENRQLPEMDRDSEAFAQCDLEVLSDSALAEELQCRNETNSRWTAVYWSDFIPFAHGARLFGELYNEVMQPVDPFEFVSLLSGETMLSTERNNLLYDCARMAKHDGTIRDHLSRNELHLITKERFQQNLQVLKQQYSFSDFDSAKNEHAPDHLLAALIMQYATLDEPLKTISMADRAQKEQLFKKHGAARLPIDPGELLKLARASYRLRDDDNIHIGRIHQELDRAAVHARERLKKRGVNITEHVSIEDVISLLQGASVAMASGSPAQKTIDDNVRAQVRARQLLGQPASPGIAKGKARVIRDKSELREFQRGDILVTDAIDPTMTFFAPLAGGIIERRGGMLIHGAIIAREYGIPCITGITDATKFISSGDKLIVDGYLGIVTVERA